MRKTLRLALTILLFTPAFAWRAQGAQQASQPAQTQTQTPNQAPNQTQTPNQNKTLSPATPANPVVEAARKTRQNQKSAPAPVVFTNENLPKSSSISIVGNAPRSDAGAQAQAEAAAEAKDDERMWRQKFADARAKLRQDKEKLAMLKSDLNALGMVRYFNENDAVTKQQAVIDEENQINVDQKALDDLEDALRKAGGDPALAQ
ncbi:MAG: hypothetical protein WA876_07720 [Candidatus Acidiferrales bacterium]